MRYYVGLDVSLHMTSICIINEKGETFREGSAPSDAKTITAWIRGDRLRIHRVGLEAGALSRALCQSLIRAGLPAICIEAKHAHAVLSARMNKTDDNDARGIADLMRTSTYKAVHIKSQESQRAQAVLTARKLLSTKLVDVENAIGGILRAFAIKIGRPKQKSYEQRVRAALGRQEWLETVIDPLLQARAALRTQFDRLDKKMDSLAREDVVCRRLMTAPGVGPLVALTYRAVIDDPTRFKHSKSVGAHIGLTPKTRQSADKDYRGRISKWGDKGLRTALRNAAATLFNPRTHPTALRLWGEIVAVRKGRSKAMVAVARRLAVILHRMWIDGADYSERQTTG